MIERYGNTQCITGCRAWRLADKEFKVLISQFNHPWDVLYKQILIYKARTLQIAACKGSTAKITHSVNHRLYRLML